MKKLVGTLAIMAAVGALAGSAGPARAAFTKVPDVSYELDSSGPASPLKRLDLYLPEGAAAGDLRPVVIYAHGGGWMNGDKSNKMADKPRLFTDAGYIFASVNYRLSPDIGSGPLAPQYLPGRLMYPAHPRDVGESIAWIGRNIATYGGDPDALVLTGHSAGAHLVSLVGADPSYLGAFGASLGQVIGVVSLDAGAMDVVDSATQRGAQPTANNHLIWNAFGTPAEEAAASRWYQASPTSWGDGSDPRSLMVTQVARPARIVDNEKMVKALGQDPAGVLKVPLDHEGINEELGSPSGSTGETAAVMAFVADRVASRAEPTLRIRKRPASIVRIGRRQKKRRVVLGFVAASAAKVECRIDGRAFGECVSPRVMRLARGRHRFAVRALYPSGRPAVTKPVSFRIKTKRRSGRSG